MQDKKKALTSENALRLIETHWDFLGEGKKFLIVLKAKYFQ